MRPDMSKVVTERPRAGGGVKDPKGTKKRFQRTPGEEQPKRESIGKRWYSYGKEFTDLIGPLRKFVLSNVGRPWDKVYSEFCSTITSKNKQDVHIRGHLWDFVTEKVIMIGKTPYNPDGELQVYTDTYVCPKTGLLKKTKDPGYRFRHNYQDRGQKRVAVNKTLEYRQIKGVWHRVTLAPMPWSVTVYDVVAKMSFQPELLLGTHKSWSQSYRERLYGYNGDVYAEEINQASKSELRQYVYKEAAPQPVAKKRRRR